MRCFVLVVSVLLSFGIAIHAAVEKGSNQGRTLTERETQTLVGGQQHGYCCQISAACTPSVDIPFDCGSVSDQTTCNGIDSWTFNLSGANYSTCQTDSAGFNCHQGAGTTPCLANYDCTWDIITGKCNVTWEGNIANAPSSCGDGCQN